MARDLDKFNPTVSVEILKENLLKIIPYKWGLNLSSTDRDYLELLENNLQPGDKFPIQIAAGPLLNVSGDNSVFIIKPNTSLDKMILSKQIQLFVHLPFSDQP